MANAFAISRVTNVLSVTSLTGHDLAIGTGTFGPALTFTSATGAAAFVGGGLDMVTSPGSAAKNFHFDSTSINGWATVFLSGNGTYNTSTNGLSSDGTILALNSGSAGQIQAVLANATAHGWVLTSTALTVGSATTLTANGSILASGASAPTNTTSGSNQFSSGAAFNNAIFGTTANFSGQVVASQTNGNSASLVVANTGAQATDVLATFLAPNTTTGTTSQGPYIPVGVALSTNNAAVIQFSYLGAGSATNTLGLGLYGASKWFLDGNGNTTQTGNLTVSGTGTSNIASTNLQINSALTTYGLELGTSTNDGGARLTGSGIGGPNLIMNATNATAGNRYTNVSYQNNGTAQWSAGLRAGDGLYHIYDAVRSVDVITLAPGASAGVAGATTFVSTTPGTSTSAAAILGKSMGLTENLWVGGLVSAGTNLFVNGATATSAPANTQQIIAGAYASGSVDALYGRLQIGVDNNNGFGAYFASRRDAGAAIHAIIGVRSGAADASAIDILYGAANSQVVAISGTTDATTVGAGSLTTAGGLYAAKRIVSGTEFINSGGLGHGVTSTATAGGTTILSGTSAAIQIFTGSSAQSVTLPAANAYGSTAGVVLFIKNRSTGSVTINRAGSDTIDGGTSYVLLAGANDGVVLVSDGVSAWSVV